MLCDSVLIGTHSLDTLVIYYAIECFLLARKMPPVLPALLPLSIDLPPRSLLLSAGHWPLGRDLLGVPWSGAGHGASYRGGAGRASVAD